MSDETSISDHELVDQFQNASGAEKEEAFSELYRRYEQKLRWYLTRLTEDEELAGDLTQEAFVKALRGLDEFEGRSRFKTWLYRIAMNTWKNYIKKHRPVSGVVEENDRVEANTPDREVERDERAEQVHRALSELPEKYRAPIMLVRFEGMQYSEAASALDLTTDSVRMRLHRARKALKEELEQRMNV